MEFLVKYIVVFLTSLVAVVILVPLVKKLAPALNMVDEPDERRITYSFDDVVVHLLQVVLPRGRWGVAGGEGTLSAPGT